ncbi:MAG: TraR/DksA family transcriptional regulator [Bacteriovoracaceae bacterium]|jgi:DnaK suppressor protein|nr:TraR/DksA family transcriptional regulator [Bacteriovoracaceae bacterium]
MSGQMEVDKILGSLKEKREQVVNRINALQKDRRRKGGPISPDFAEQVVEVENDEVVDAIDDLERRELSQIDEAIARVNNGDYGICRNCGEQIPEKRLIALPTAFNCINCSN